MELARGDQELLELMEAEEENIAQEEEKLEEIADGEYHDGGANPNDSDLMVRIEEERDELNGGRHPYEVQREQLLDKLEKGERVNESITISPAQGLNIGGRSEAKRYAFDENNALKHETVEAFVLDIMEKNGPNFVNNGVASPLLRCSNLNSLISTLAPYLDSTSLKRFVSACKETFVKGRHSVRARVERYPEMVDPIHLMPEQYDAYYKAVVLGRNIYICGEAGAGKSVTLRAIVAGLRKKRVMAIDHVNGERSVRPFNVLVMAPTGTAAEICEGVTIASVFGQLSGTKQYTDPAKHYPSDPFRGGKAMKLRDAEALIYDEISMVSSQDWDLMSSKIKGICHSSRPFGGKQVIACGDFAQLSPVSSTIASECPRLHERCLNSLEWREVFGDTWDYQSEQVALLSQPVRQNEDEKDLRDALNELRMFSPGPAVSRIIAERSYAVLNAINGKGRDPALAPDNLVLASDNKFVDLVNTGKLKKLVEKQKKEQRTYNARWENGPNGCDWPSNVPQSTTIADGAKVRLTRNAIGCHLTNGSFGTVIGMANLSDDKVWIRMYRSQVKRAAATPDHHPLYLLSTEKIDIDCNTGRVQGPHWATTPGSLFPIVVFDSQPHTHYLVGYFTTPIKDGRALDDRVLASYAHVPLKVAYASTFHSCQGSTVYGNVTFNMSKCFSAEQVYVGFSRVKTKRQVVIAETFNQHRLYGPMARAKFCDGTLRLMKIFEIRKEFIARRKEKQALLLREIEDGRVTQSDAVKRCLARVKPRRAAVPCADLLRRMEETREKLRADREAAARARQIAAEEAKSAKERTERELQERLRKETLERLEKEKTEREERIVKERAEVLRRKQAREESERAIAAAMAEEGEPVTEQAIPAAAEQLPSSGSKRSQPEKEESKICVICMDGPKECVIIPCGHLQTCVPCGTHCMENTGECPICKGDITSVHKVY
jgi:hypothetical protein